MTHLMPSRAGEALTFSTFFFVGVAALDFHVCFARQTSANSGLKGSKGGLHVRVTVYMHGNQSLPIAATTVASSARHLPTLNAPYQTVGGADTVLPKRLVVPPDAPTHGTEDALDNSDFFFPYIAFHGDP